MHRRVGDASDARRLSVRIFPRRDDRRGDALGSEHVAEGVGGVVADVDLIDEIGGHGDCGWRGVDVRSRARGNVDRVQRRSSLVDGITRVENTNADVDAIQLFDIFSRLNCHTFRPFFFFAATSY